jgi:hypothetical protein
MSIEQLATQLMADAANQVPPFGAESIKLARQLGPAATSFLIAQVKARGEDDFLALEALREADMAAYNSLPGPLRAEIYSQALQNSTFFNAWGLPGYQLTPTSQALIALGKIALPSLLPLLADKRPAPLAGSRDATTSTIYGNRICDYAWVFLQEIRGESYSYSQDPVERNQEIEALQRALTTETDS